MRRRRGSWGGSWSLRIIDACVDRPRWSALARRPTVLKGELDQRTTSAQDRRSGAVNSRQSQCPAALLAALVVPTRSYRAEPIFHALRHVGEGVFLRDDATLGGGIENIQGL